MKSPVRTIAGSTNYLERQLEKQKVSDLFRSRGGVSQPQTPRDVQVQSAAGGVMVTWKLPTFHDNISGWRVYVNTESNLAAQIRDKGTRQLFIPLGSSASPTPVNVMVSSLTALGRESGKTIKQGAPASQSTTTTVPSVPPGYDAEQAGGANRSLIRFRGETQYVNS